MSESVFSMGVGVAGIELDNPPTVSLLVCLLNVLLVCWSEAILFLSK